MTWVLYTVYWVLAIVQWFILQCSIFAVQAPVVTTNIISPILLRSPVTISCTVNLSFKLWSNAEVQVTWSKDGTVLQNSSHVSITTVMQVVGTNNSYQSNLTVDRLVEADSGVYSCYSLVVLHPSNHTITSTAIGASFLSVQCKWLLSACVKNK